jgi:putative serine protease PepD
LDGFFKTAFLFSLNGDVVAVYDQKTGVSAIGGFLPIIKGLLEKSEFKHPSLGVIYVDLSSLAIKDSRYEKGAIVVSDGKRVAVEAGSAAAEAGLKEGDVILSINGVSIDYYNRLSSVLQKYQAGDVVSVIYLRDGQERKMDIKLKELKK